MATVHGRTRAQFYAGRADWRAARAVVEAVAMPVIVNGDCAGLEDARAMLAQSGASGVMIGRAALGAPWLVGAVSARPEAWRRRFGFPPARNGAPAALEHLDWLLGKLGAPSRPAARPEATSAYAECRRRAGGAPPRTRDDGRSRSRPRICSTALSTQAPLEVAA